MEHYAQFESETLAHYGQIVADFVADNYDGDTLTAYSDFCHAYDISSAPTRESILNEQVQQLTARHGNPVAVCLQSGGGIAYATFIINGDTLLGYDLSPDNEPVLEFELPLTPLASGTLLGLPVWEEYGDILAYWDEQEEHSPTDYSEGDYYVFNMATRVLTVYGVGDKKTRAPRHRADTVSYVSGRDWAENHDIAHAEVPPALLGAPAWVREDNLDAEEWVAGYSDYRRECIAIMADTLPAPLPASHVVGMYPVPSVLPVAPDTDHYSFMAGAL